MVSFPSPPASEVVPLAGPVAKSVVQSKTVVEPVRVLPSPGQRGVAGDPVVATADGDLVLAGAARDGR